MDHSSGAAEILQERAAGYARMAWHDRYARGLVASLDLPVGATVVDAGAGTGFASRAMARRVRPTGRVIAVDLTSAMAEHLYAPADGESAPVEVVVGEATSSTSRTVESTRSCVRRLCSRLLQAAGHRGKRVDMGLYALGSGG